MHLHLAGPLLTSRERTTGDTPPALSDERPEHGDHYRARVQASTGVDPRAAPSPGPPAAAGRRVLDVLGRHPALLVTALLLLLTLAFFRPLLTGGHFSTIPGHHSAVYPWAGLPPNGMPFFPQSDQADLSHPWHTLLTEALDDGSFPFWDPHSYGGGYPLYANGSSAQLYPPRVLTALLFDPVRAHDVFLLLHVFLSGLAMYALMRELAVGRAGSILAAVSWMFAGFNLAWLHLEVVTPMSVFLPLDLLCVHRAHRTRSWGNTVVAGLALGATLMSGHLILLGLVYGATAGYAGALTVAALVRSARAGSWRDGLPAVARTGVIGAVSVGFAMVLLLPTSYALGDSQRDPFTYDELVQSFLAPARVLVYGIVPPPLPVTAERMHEMTFAGTATGLLAVAGVLVRRRGAWLGRVTLLAALAIALGTPATWFAFHFIPGFDIFRPYSRLLAFSTFAIAVLGGIGLDALWRLAERRRLEAEPDQRARRPDLTRAVAAFSVVVVGVTAVQLGRYGRDVNPPPAPSRIDDYFDRTPLIAALERETLGPDRWPGRVLPTRVFEPGTAAGPTTLFAAEALVFGLDSTSGYDSAVPRRVTALMRALQGEPADTVLAQGLPSAYAPAFESPATRFDLAPRLGITALATNPGVALERTPTPGGPLPPTEVAYEGPDGRVLRIAGASAAPYLVGAEDVVDSPADAFRRFLDPQFDFTRSVVVESEELERADVAPLGAAETPSAPAADGQAVVDGRRGINSARVTVTTPAPRWLVFHESWGPGWSATVNGEDAEVVRVNYAKRAVQVPAGRSVVRLRYRPPGLVTGAAVTLLTLFGCAAAPVAARRWARRRPADPR